MRRFVWLSLATAGLVTACVVGIDDVESKKPANGTGGSSGNDGSVGGSGTGATGGANTGGAPTGGASGSGGSGGAAIGGAGGTGALGGSGGRVSGGGTGGANPCPSGMVAVPSSSGEYCVDSTEVTQTSYAKFLIGVVPTQPDSCAGNKLEPECPEYNPTLYPNRPVVCVDWCDARAFCTAAGKRMCGKVGGGTVDPGAYLDANSNEWFRACSNGGTQKFPYGSLYGAGKCNDINAPTTSPTNVGSLAQCVGGYPGLYDMSGNVREWEDSCNVNGCNARGGAYLDLPDNVTCTAAILTTRTAATKELGFRCCSD
jgi:sulfatase modifying factor 1